MAFLFGTNTAVSRGVNPILTAIPGLAGTYAWPQLVINAGGQIVAISSLTTYTGNLVLAPTSGVALTIKGTANGASFQAWTDGTSTAAIFSAANAIDFGAISTNASLNLWAGGTQYVSLGTAGNVTIGPPASGVTTLTIKGASGLGIDLWAGAANGGVLIQGYNSTGGTRIGYLDFVSGTGGLLGATEVLLANDAATANDIVTLVAGGVRRLQIAGNGSSIKGWGPSKGAIVDMTPDSGTFTGTITGVSNTTTGVMTWSRMGNLVMIAAPAGMVGTSNSASMTMTGLPAAIQPTRTQLVCCSLEDDGSNVLATAEVVASSGTIIFLIGVTTTLLGTSYTAFNSANFSTSGQKGLNDTTFSYLLN